MLVGGSLNANELLDASKFDVMSLEDEHKLVASDSEDEDEDEEIDD